MECKACGVWFVSGDKSGLCHTCKRTLKNMGIDIPYDRLSELVEADKDGRCVVLWCSPGDRLYSESCIKGEVNEFFAPNDIEWILEHAEDYGKTIFKDYELCNATMKGDRHG